MQIVEERGNDEVAKLYIAKLRDYYIEFVESKYPNRPREEKWVIVISCLLGCPVQCLMCDAGKRYCGKLSKEEMLEQIDHIVDRHFPSRIIPVKKFKIQFTRMGEPAFNEAVLDLLEELPVRYQAPGLIPSVSTVGPKNTGDFFDLLIQIKKKLYEGGHFQMQFSIHTTDVKKRDELIPTPKMSFEEIAAFGERFYSSGDRKITLNFIVMEAYPIEPHVIAKYFNPAHFILKFTPLNPTARAQEKGLINILKSHTQEEKMHDLLEACHALGFETIVSIGELEENSIGSNCGQYVSNLVSQQA
jgi:23S rRNA (adenine2503-C2)-methyltransferase